MNSRTDTAASEVEPALDAHAELGEGPTWHAAEGVLVWVDITRHLVHRYNPVTGRDESIEVSQHVGTTPRAAGGLVLALRDGFGILDTASGRVEMIVDTEADSAGNGDELLIADFVDAVRDGGSPLASGEDGLRAVEVVQAAYASIASGLPVEVAR